MIVVLDVVRDLVSRASKKYGKDIFFFADNIIQINQQLTDLSGTKKGRELKYPCIMLLMPFSELHNQPKPWTLEARLQLLIVTTKEFDMAEKKIENTYKNVLYPIYESFLCACDNDKRIVSRPEIHLIHEKIDRISLSEALNEAIKQQGLKSIFNDKLDGIEIRNLGLKIEEIC